MNAMSSLILSPFVINLLLLSPAIAQENAQQESPADVRSRILATLQKRVEIAQQVEEANRLIAQVVEDQHKNFQATDLDVDKRKLACLEAQQRTIDVRAELLTTKVRFSGVPRDSELLALAAQQRQLTQQALALFEDMRKWTNDLFRAGRRSVLDVAHLDIEIADMHDRLLLQQNRFDEIQLGIAEQRLRQQPK